MGKKEREIDGGRREGGGVYSKGRRNVEREHRRVWVKSGGESGDQVDVLSVK